MGLSIKSIALNIQMYSFLVTVWDWWN